MGYKIRVLSAEEISRTFNGGNRALEVVNNTSSDSVFLSKKDINAITKALRKTTTVPVGRATTSSVQPNRGSRPLIKPGTITGQTPVPEEITPVATTNEDDLFNRLINRITPVSSGANGEIDQNFRQGRTGDCWLLASIQALAMSPKGLNLLNDSIKKLPDGRIQVTLKGVGATYTFTEEELRSRSKLSSGDLDVRALEMAVEKYLKKHPMNGHSTLNGNLGWVAFKLITGKNVSNSDTGRFSDRQIDAFNNTNHVAVVAHNGNGKHRYKNKKGKTEELIGNHEYAVKGSDRENVYLINPWNTAEVISVPRAEFKRFFNFVNEFEL